MINRRHFLLTSLATATSFLSGCSRSQDVLDVNLLQGSIPPQLIGDFYKNAASKNQIRFKPSKQIQQIFEFISELKEDEKKQTSSILKSLPGFGQQSAQENRLVSLGDAWLKEAIAQNLIQPLNLDNLDKWQQIAPIWKNLVKRDSQGNPSPQGKFYGAPYRWGSVVIAYRKDKIDWTPQNWSDLWKEELRGRISLLDNYREVIGLTLKKMGYSYNTKDLSQIKGLSEELQQLHQQVKFYSSDKYLQPLLLGDTWLAVGWSSDILSITDRYKDIGIIVPNSGTSLWSELWVQPSSKSPSPNQDNLNSLAQAWIDYCWETTSIRQILLFTDGISPTITSNKAGANSRTNFRSKELEQDLESKPVLKSMLATFSQSEFLDFFPPKIDKSYLALWQKIRTAKT